MCICELLKRASILCCTSELFSEEARRRALRELEHGFQDVLCREETEAFKTGFDI